MHEPESYAEAAKDANWHAAMEEEMHALAENETWDLVDAPKGVKPNRFRWVYKVKYNIDGSVNRYKAQLVEKGYVQKQDIDYDETFASVAKMTTVLFCSRMRSGFSEAISAGVIRRKDVRICSAMGSSCASPFGTAVRKR